MEPSVEQQAGSVEVIRPRLVPVEITIDELTRIIEVPSGPTVVSTLKEELAVPAEDTLFEVRPVKRPLDDHDIVDVEDGQAFEAIHGGGVS